MRENIKAPRHWSLFGEFTGDRWIPRTNGQWRGKCFHLMTSSCNHINLWKHEKITCLNRHTLSAEQNGQHFSRAIFQMYFSWMKMFEFLIKFLWNESPMVQLIYNYLNQPWPTYLMPYDVNRPQKANFILPMFLSKQAPTASHSLSSGPVASLHVGPVTQQGF